MRFLRSLGTVVALGVEAPPVCASSGLVCVRPDLHPEWLFQVCIRGIGRTRLSPGPHEVGLISWAGSATGEENGLSHFAGAAAEAGGSCRPPCGSTPWRARGRSAHGFPGPPPRGEGAPGSGQGMPSDCPGPVRGGCGTGSTGSCWVSAVTCLCAAAPRTEQRLIASTHHPALVPKSGKHFWGVQTPDFTEVSE